MTNAGRHRRVLIDGAYHNLARGTGISTYARTLAAALSAMGDQATWLSGARAARNADPLADAALAADEPPALRGPRQWAQTVGAMAGGITTSSVMARRIAAPEVVAPRPETLPLRDTLLAPGAFVTAHYRHMLLRRFLEVRSAERFDVLHLTAPLPLQMKGVKTVVTIHDLVPIRLPYTTSDNKREFIDRVRTSVRLADLVVTVSESSKAEIVELLQVDPARVAVTYQSAELAALTPAEKETVPRSLARYGLTQDGFGLFVGAIEPKKNVRRLIEAFLDASDDTPLVIVGARAWKWQDEIGDIDHKLGDAARKRVRFLGHVEREDLRRLYAGAATLVFPSLHEGFGLPALEAMTMECPVIASRAGGLAEVCGEAAAFVDPLDRADMTRTISDVLGDPTRRRRMVVDGLAQARRFSFEAYVARLEAAYALLGPT